MNFSKPPLTSEARAREAQADFMQETIHKVEKYFGQICNDMGNIARKTARLRDKYDALAKTCLDYSNVEQGPLHKSLTSFAEQISNIQDYRQAQIERLQAKVVDPLQSYDQECKHTKADLNKSLKARKQELRQQQRVLNIQKRSPSDHLSISRAEAELQKQGLDVARSTQALEETIDKFETKKIQDLKKMLCEFVKIELLFHAKALEVYTKVHNDLVLIDEEKHLEVFRNSLHPLTNTQERLELAKNAVDTSQSYDENTSSLQSGIKMRVRSDRRKNQEDEDQGDFLSDEEYDEEDDYESEESYDYNEDEDVGFRPASFKQT